MLIISIASIFQKKKKSLQTGFYSTIINIKNITCLSDKNCPQKFVDNFYLINVYKKVDNNYPLFSYTNHKL